MSYSLDFRRKVLSVRERDKLSFREVADRFSVGVASVVRELYSKVGDGLEIGWRIMGVKASIHPEERTDTPWTRIMYWSLCSQVNFQTG